MALEILVIQLSHTSCLSRVASMPNTDIPCFLKVCVTPRLFYEIATSVPVFANRKKSEQYFCFMKTGQKLKTVFSVCFAASCSRGNGHSEQ